MVVLNLVIISAILKNQIQNGSSSMMKESDSLILMILNLIVLVVSIGEDKVRVHISLYMKRCIRNLLDWNSHQLKKKIRS